MKFDPTATLQAHALAVLQDPSSGVADRSAATQALLRADGEQLDVSHLSDAEVAQLDVLIRKAMNRPAVKRVESKDIESKDEAMLRHKGWSAAQAAGKAVRAAEAAAAACGEPFDLRELATRCTCLATERDAARVDAQHQAQPAEVEASDEEQAAARRTDRKMKVARQLNRSFQR